MSLAALFLILAAVQSPSTSDWCRGVAIETASGPANFVGLSAEGDEGALRRFRAAADEMNFGASGPSVGVAGNYRVVVWFKTTKNSPSESTNPADATSFLQRAQQGEFGELQIRTLMMPIDTLPEDRC